MGLQACSLQGYIHELFSWDNVTIFPADSLYLLGVISPKAALALSMEEDSQCTTFYRYRRI